MSNTVILEYLKSIQKTVSDIDSKMDKHDMRLSSLEETRASQKGVMLGGGAVVTFFAGVISWLTGNHQ